jgi:hypothetical protein
VNRVWQNQLFWAIALVVAGLYFLFHNLGLLDWLRPEIFWPVILIALGVWLIVRRSRT